MKPLAQQSEQKMKTNVPIKEQPVEAKTQPPDIQRRINAGWLRLWRAICPSSRPPPRHGCRRHQRQNARAAWSETHLKTFHRP